jgi:F-type H+-transporting ATPase subunit b
VHPDIQFNPVVIEDTRLILSLLIGFALLAWLVLRVNIPFLSVPHYRAVLTERATRIETNKNQVDQALAEVSQLRNDYATRLARIEAEARERIDAAVREADAARAEIIAEAEQTAQVLRRRSEEEVARERTRQRILFRQQLVQRTLDSAESAIRAHSDENVQRSLISDFISRAGSGAIPTATAQSQTQGGA